MFDNAKPIYTDSVVHLNPEVTILFKQFFGQGRRLYLLDDLRATDEHDWGWVVGNLGYIEIASISEGGDEIELLVASDD